MTKRKSKPTFPSMIELPLPAERLQLATVTVEQKASARDGHSAPLTELPVALPRRGKITLH